MNLFVHRVAAEIVYAEMIMEFPTEPMSYIVTRNGQYRSSSFTEASPGTEFRVGSAMLLIEPSNNMLRVLSSRSTVKLHQSDWAEKATSTAGDGPGITSSVLWTLT